MVLLPFYMGLGKDHPFECLDSTQDGGAGGSALMVRPFPRHCGWVSRSPRARLKYGSSSRRKG